MVIYLTVGFCLWLQRLSRQSALFSGAASDIVIGERCSRVKRNCSFYPHVAHCGVGIWSDNRVAIDCSKCSSCMKRHLDLFL